MVLKAIVEQLEENGYQAKVRIPKYNQAESAPTATPTDELYTATICTLPSISPALKVGDVVFVAFENDMVNTPVIIGLLFRADMGDTMSNFNFDTTQVVTSINGKTGNVILKFEDLASTGVNQIQLYNPTDNITIEDNTEYEIFDATSVTLVASNGLCHGFIYFSTTSGSLTLSGFTKVEGDPTEATANTVFEFSSFKKYIILKNWTDVG